MKTTNSSISLVTDGPEIYWGWYKIYALFKRSDFEHARRRQHYLSTSHPLSSSREQHSEEESFGCTWGKLPMIRNPNFPAPPSHTERILFLFCLVELFLFGLSQSCQAGVQHPHICRSNLYWTPKYSFCVCEVQITLWKGIYGIMSYNPAARGLFWFSSQVKISDKYFLCHT